MRKKGPFKDNTKNSYQGKSTLVHPKEDLFVDNLRELKEIFDEFGIKFWLDWGTLLGAVRDKKIIPWDDDIDLGTMEDNYKKIISSLPRFKEKGFAVVERPVPIPNSDTFCTNFSFSKPGCKIETFPYYLKDKNTWVTFTSRGKYGNLIRRTLISMPWLLWSLLLSAEWNSLNKFKLVMATFIKYCLFLFPNKLKKFLIKKLRKKLEVTLKMIIIPRHYFERLGTIKFYRMTFNIPSDVENYLKYHYGKNWKIPNKNWFWVKDDGAVRSLTE